MNIVLIVNDPNVLRERSGVRSAILDQAALADHILVIVLNAHREYFETQKISESILIVPTNSWTSWLAPFDALRIARRQFFFQGRFQADLVSTYDPCMAGFAGLLLSTRYKKPLHVHIEKNVFSRQFIFASTMALLANSIRTLVARSVVRAASSIHVTSEDIKASLTRIVPAIAERVVVFPQFVDVEAFQNEPVHIDLHAKYPQYKFIMLTVIPPDSSHRLDRAVEVLSGVLKQYAHAGLVVLSEYISDRSLRAYGKRLGVSGRIAVEKSSENFVSYLKTANVFFMSDVREDPDNIIAIALSCGCPVVCPAIGIAPFALSEGNSGFICDKEDTKCFVGHIMQLLNNSSLRAHIQFNSSGLLEASMGGTKEGYLQRIQDSWKLALPGEREV